MTLKEQTYQAATDHVDGQLRDYDAAHIGFITGAEWERERDKWLYVKGKRENLPPPGKYWIIVTFELNNRLELRDFPQQGFTFEFCCDWWLRFVKCYQPLPEPPKQ